MVGSGITALLLGITSHEIGISIFLRDQESGCAIFVGSRDHNFSQFWDCVCAASVH